MRIKQDKKDYYTGWDLAMLIRKNVKEGEVTIGIL
jgi:hypothetical protein